MDTPVFPNSERKCRHVRRLIAVLGFAVAVVVVSTGCMPELLVPATSGRNYGQGPLDAIREAADRTTTMKLPNSDRPDPNYNCGLSSTDLAAMMIVPTYFEAGGSVPSPMTLSRWDNTSGGRTSNANLFAFGQTSGPYINAFFSPGIGLWQFDSAGRWDLTAADAINVTTASNQAAQTIAYRWCNAWRQGKTATPQIQREYAWGPWYGCRLYGANSCEDVFNQLVTPDGKLNTSFDPGISRTGGMQQRVCNLRGIGDGLACFYINPALAEGSRGWQGGTYDGSGNSVTPLPKPFYSVRANGNEYRVWLKEDTGYGIDITASKPVTADARNSLTWSDSPVLCDTSNRRGFCSGFDPIGALDGVWNAGPNQIHVAGWTIDPDSVNPLDVHVYVGDVRTIYSASQNRPDVGAAFPSAGSLHGFDFTLSASVGTQNVCAYAINLGGGNNVQLGCRTVDVTGVPAGAIDVLTTSPGSLAVEGWTAVPGAATATADISVDGVITARVNRSVSRPDVAIAAPWAGSTAGFSTTLSVSGGPHTVCLTSGGAALNALGCRTVSLPTGSPYGVIDAVTPLPGTIGVSGWIIDPDSTGPVDVHVWIGGSKTVLRANQSRVDLTTFFPQYGASHGFSTMIPVAGGPQSVCVYGINSGGGSNIFMGCRQVTVPGGSPFGSLDAVIRGPNGISVAGWAIDPDTSSSIPVHVYVGQLGTAISANLSRPDVGAGFPLYGANHGYGVTLPAPQGSVQVCVYAIEASGTGTNQILGCRTV